MYITVNQLANKINNIERFDISELTKDPVNTFYIQIIDDYRNSIYRFYCTCTEEQAQTKAKNACQLYKSLDKCNYEYKVYKIK